MKVFEICKKIRAHLMKAYQTTCFLTFSKSSFTLVDFVEIKYLLLHNTSNIFNFQTFLLILHNTSNIFNFQTLLFQTDYHLGNTDELCIETKYI